MPTGICRLLVQRPGSLMLLLPVGVQDVSFMHLLFCCLDVGNLRHLFILMLTYNIVVGMRISP